MFRRLVAAAATVAALAVGAAVPTPVWAAAARCPTGWGSLPESRSGPGDGLVGDVRAGQHRCFDRLVVDVHDGAALDWYSVRYVPEVKTDGEGAIIPTRGGASLEVVLAARATDFDQQVRFPQAGRDPSELVNVRGYRTFRQVVWALDFEGLSTIGIGTRSRLPFRAFTLPGPRGDRRLVIDVAHTW